MRVLHHELPMTDTHSSVPFEAALIIPVPEAEPLVARYRSAFDPAAALGVPAHVTVNYPFQPHITRPVEAHAQLSALLLTFSQFAFSLSEIRSFPGVIYLAPTPPGPFISLINAIAAAFPDSPPYEGQFEAPVPHLTVAQVEPAAFTPILTNLAREAASVLPLQAQAMEIWLMDNKEVQWRTRAVFPLGAPRDFPPA
jgi:2'-5' RNA ligase